MRAIALGYKLLINRICKKDGKNFHAIEFR